MDEEGETIDIEVSVLVYLWFAIYPYVVLILTVIDLNG